MSPGQGLSRAEIPTVQANIQDRHRADRPHKAEVRRARQGRQRRNRLQRVRGRPTRMATDTSPLGRAAPLDWANFPGLVLGCIEANICK